MQWTVVHVITEDINSKETCWHRRLNSGNRHGHKKNSVKKWLNTKICHSDKNSTSTVKNLR